ncbi:MAG: alpha/beta hydrolase [Clostridia bacterium]|nr:alpha/beta hydrolase [Clostridia bacterium]
MLNEKVDLYKYFNLSRGSLSGGYLQLYCPAACETLKKKERGCLLVIPGGGYSHISPREGEPVALRFVANGFCAAVLTYSVNAPYPAPLNEACLAVKYLRQNAEALGINPQKICAVGFSAGGHLAGLLATLKEGEAAFGSAKELKPNAVILSYPVVTMENSFAHLGTREIITDGGRVRAELSVDRRVTLDSAPAFIWHTFEDEAVPFENSVLLACGYNACGAPCELHLFEKGRHGLSLCDAETNDFTAADAAATCAGEWVKLSLNWLRTRGIM